MLQERRPVLLHIGAIFTVSLLIMWLEIRPYGVLFTLLMAFWIYRTRCSSLTLVPPPTINQKLEEAYRKLSLMRQEQPKAFCAIASAGFISLALVGHILSGSSIVVFGLLLAAVIFSRHKITIITSETKDDATWSSQTTDHDIDEFLPEINETNLFILKQASEKAVLSPTSPQDNADENIEEDKSDEIMPADFLIPESIPEIDEHTDNSSDDDEEDSLLVSSPAEAPLLKQQYSPNRKIEFQSGYFKNTSSSSASSSDDDSITKGLHFQDYSLVDHPTTTTTTTMALPKSLLQSQSSDATIKTNVPAELPKQKTQSSYSIPSLMSGIMTTLLPTTTSSTNQGSSTPTRTAPNKQNIQSKRQSSQKPPQFDSSDESEFEIVNSEELNQFS